MVSDLEASQVNWDCVLGAIISHESSASSLSVAFPSFVLCHFFSEGLCYRLWCCLMYVEPFCGQAMPVKPVGLCYICVDFSPFRH